MSLTINALLVLRLAVGEAGSAAEPAPIGGAPVCAQLLG
jgi:hypothetical protein